jgi:hypothetical protein
LRLDGAICLRGCGLFRGGLRRAGAPRLPLGLADLLPPSSRWSPGQGPRLASPATSKRAAATKDYQSRVEGAIALVTETDEAKQRYRPRAGLVELANAPNAW